MPKAPTGRARGLSVFNSVADQVHALFASNQQRLQQLDDFESAGDDDYDDGNVSSGTSGSTASSTVRVRGSGSSASDNAANLSASNPSSPGSQLNVQEILARQHIDSPDPQRGDVSDNGTDHDQRVRLAAAEKLYPRSIQAMREGEEPVDEETQLRNTVDRLPNTTLSVLRQIAAPVMSHLDETALVENDLLNLRTQPALFPEDQQIQDEFGVESRQDFCFACYAISRHLQRDHHSKQAQLDNIAFSCIAFQDPIRLVKEIKTYYEQEIRAKTNASVMEKLHEYQEKQRREGKPENEAHVRRIKASMLEEWPSISIFNHYFTRSHRGCNPTTVVLAGLRETSMLASFMYKNSLLRTCTSRRNPVLSPRHVQLFLSVLQTNVTLAQHYNGLTTGTTVTFSQNKDPKAIIPASMEEVDNGVNADGSLRVNTHAAITAHYMM